MYIASDHAGVLLKANITKLLIQNNMVGMLTDVGTHTPDSCDYADYAHELAQKISQNPNQKGILICGSGVGVSIVANRHAGVRAALCWQPEIAVLARQHNNANVLCLPARFVSVDMAWQIVVAFLETKFEGGRHQSRIEKIELNQK